MGAKIQHPFLPCLIFTSLILLSFYGVVESADGGADTGGSIGAGQLGDDRDIGVFDSENLNGTGDITGTLEQSGGDVMTPKAVRLSIIFLAIMAAVLLIGPAYDGWM